MKQSKNSKIKELFARGAKGAISILLCLVITPFLGVSVALVEYSRYQEVIELVDELEELTGMSLLADYDQYIHNRFGILATSQQQDFNAVASAYMMSNAGALGNQITVNSVTAKGGMSLNENEVLKHQILDVAETTGLAQVLVEDFNIDELMNALNGLEKFNKLTNTIDNIADLSKDLESAVKTAESLKKNLESVQKAVVNLENEGKSLAQKIASFYEKLYTAGYEFPDNLTETEFDELLSTVLGEYEANITDIYKTANNVVTYVNNIKSGIPKIVADVEALDKLVDSISKKSENITSDNSSDKQVTEKTGKALADVVKEMEKIVDSCIKKLKDGSLETVKKAAQEIVDTSLKSLGLGDAPARYNLILKGKYFGDPPSDMAKQDFKDLISCLPDVWDEKSADSVLELLKEKFAPKINFPFSSIISNIARIVEETKNTLVNDAQESVFDSIIKLVNIVRKLFELNVFYDGELNALTNISQTTTSGYQDFLNELNKALTAISKATTSLNEGDFFAIIGAIVDLCESVGGILKAITKIVTDTLKSMWDMVAQFTQGNGLNNLYEKLLVAGYAVHNFPNRTDKGRELDSDYNDSMSTVRLHLNGQGLTGFSYNDIARPYKYASEYSIATGITGLANSFGSDISKGSDTMFKGAEAEYIVAATNSEIMNQTIVFFNLYFLRMVCSLPAVFVDGEVATLATAANVACWVVYILYAIIEPFSDCLLLVNGTSVPIVKVDCYLTPSKAADFAKKLSKVCLSEEVIKTIGDLDGGEDWSSKENTSSLGKSMLEADYGSHLLILTAMNLTVDTMIERIQTLIELEAAEYYRQRNQKFDMNKTYATLTITADITFNPFIDFGALAGDNSPLQIRKKMTQVVGY